MLYIYDSFCIGDKRDIEETMTLIRLIFNITVEGKLNEFLGCNIIRDPENLICWLHQPHLIEKLKKNFGMNVVNV